MIDDVNLFKKIKQGEIANQYFLFGQETYFIYSCAEKIAGKVVSSGFEGFNLVKLDGGEISQIEEAVITLPMMAEKKCVLVKDLDIDKLSKDEYDNFIEIISNPNNTTVLVIYSDKYDFKKSSRIKKVVKLIEENGVACDFSLKDKLTLKRALCEKTKKSAISMDMSVAEFLIDRCSQSYTILENEINKLIAYAQEKSAQGIEKNITINDVLLCCSATIDSSAFDLAKAIMNRKYDSAFTILDELFSQRVEALAILGALNMCFIDLYRARVALSAGKTIDQVVEDFSYPKNRTFAVKNAFKDIKSYSENDIRRCLRALTEADLLLKSSKSEDRLLLENMITKMAG